MIFEQYVIFTACYWLITYCLITAAAALRNSIRYCILPALRYRRPERGGKLVNIEPVTSCPACGGMIADNASACQRCSAIFLKPRISVVAVGHVIMLVIAIFFHRERGPEFLFSGRASQPLARVSRLYEPSSWARCTTRRVIPSSNLSASTLRFSIS